MPQGLGDHRPSRPCATGQVALRYVHHPVPDVADRSSRRREVLDPSDREPEVGGHIGQVALRDGSRPSVAHGAEGLRRHPLDLLEIVVALAHFVAHGRVGRTGAQYRSSCVCSPRRSLVRHLADPVEQGDDVLERSVVEAGAGAQVRQLEGLVTRVFLHVGQSDFQLGAPVGRARRQKVGRATAQRGGELADRGQSGLPVAVLQQRQVRGRSPDQPAERFEGEAGLAPHVP